MVLRNEADSLKRHVEAFRDVGAEAGADGDAAANLLRRGIGGPDRVAAGAEERIGVRRLGLGCIERIMRVGLEDAQPPSVWTLITSLLSRVSARLTVQRKYSDVLVLKM